MTAADRARLGSGCRARLEAALAGSPRRVLAEACPVCGAEAGSWCDDRKAPTTRVTLTVSVESWVTDYASPFPFMRPVAWRWCVEREEADLGVIQIGSGICSTQAEAFRRGPLAGGWT